MNTFDCCLFIENKRVVDDILIPTLTWDFILLMKDHFATKIEALDIGSSNDNVDNSHEKISIISEDITLPFSIYSPTNKETNNSDNHHSENSMGKINGLNANDVLFREKNTNLQSDAFVKNIENDCEKPHESMQLETNKIKINKGELVSVKTIDNHDDSYCVTDPYTLSTVFEKHPSPSLKVIRPIPPERFFATEALPIEVSTSQEEDKREFLGKRMSRSKRPNNPARTGARIRKCCDVAGCQKWARKKNKCQAHGAQTLRRYCTKEGCISWPKKGGVCQLHGARPLRCKVDKCQKERKKGGVCIYHASQNSKTLMEKCENNINNCLTLSSETMS